MYAGGAVVLLLAVYLVLAAGGARAAMAVAAPAPRPRMSSWTPPTAAAPYLEAIAAAETQNALPTGLLARVIYQESHFRPEIVSGARPGAAGEIGIAQFMPDTAADYDVDPYDPESSIEGAARLLADLYAQFGDWALALAAYNWGQGNVRRKGISQLPASSRAYATEILADVQVFG